MGLPLHLVWRARPRPGSLRSLRPGFAVVGHACIRCGLPRPAKAAGDRCISCLAKLPSFAVCLVALRYKYPVDQLIYALKYCRQLTYARVLGELLNSDAGACAARLWVEHRSRDGATEI